MQANNKTDRPRIAIGFFGITRSLKWTLPSIQENIIEPARQLGEVRLFAHLYQQDHIENLRSGEDNPVDPDEYKLLNCDEIKLEAPGTCLATANYEWILSHGDAFNDGGKSLANLIHQLHSLQEVGRLINEWNPNIIILARPDLIYHDSFSKALTAQSNSPSNMITIPDWQWFGGYNDRFAICGAKASHTYTDRINLIPSYLKRTSGPLPAERFLKFALHSDEILLKFCSLKASRVRSNGNAVVENFKPISLGKRIKRALQRIFD